MDQRIETQLTTGRLVLKENVRELELVFTVVAADDQSKIGQQITANVEPKSIEFPGGWTQ